MVKKVQQRPTEDSGPGRSRFGRSATAPLEINMEMTTSKTHCISAHFFHCRMTSKEIERVSQTVCQNSSSYKTGRIDIFVNVRETI